MNKITWLNGSDGPPARTSNERPMSDLGAQTQRFMHAHLQQRVARWYSARWRFWAVLAGAVFALVTR